MENQSDYLTMSQNQPHLKVMAVLRRWDPIGVICDKNQNEYDAYSAKIVHMLDHDASVDDIVDYMRWVVIDRMEIGFNEPHSRDCAVELVNYWRSRKNE